jgi:hypothetical protein
MASGTADLQRDLGGALMQSIFGALLTAGYAAAVATEIAADPNSAQITASVQSQLQLSFASAESIAAQYPQYATAITAGAKEAFLAGDQWRLAGIVAVPIGAVIVFFRFPDADRERELLANTTPRDAAATGAAVAQDAPGAGGLPEGAS